MSRTAPQHEIGSTAESRSQPVLLLWWRAVRLRCPACGRAPIFRGWFAMDEMCSACGRPFARDPGYLLGSIYFNYGVTALVVVAMYFMMFFRDWFSDGQRLVILSAFAVVFPLWFFRYARAFWIAFDERWDPWEKQGAGSWEQGAGKHDHDIANQ